VPSADFFYSLATLQQGKARKVQAGCLRTFGTANEQAKGLFYCNMAVRVGGLGVRRCVMM